MLVKCTDKKCHDEVEVDPDNIPFPLLCETHKKYLQTAMNRLAQAFETDKKLRDKFIKEYADKAIKPLSDKVKTPK